MQLILVRHLWGVPEVPAACFPRFRAAGFAAIEAPVQWMKPEEETRFRDALSANQLRMLPMGFTEGAGVDDHLRSFRAVLARAAAFDPLLVNFHSGQDRWSLPDRLRFYREAVAIAKDLPFPVVHETHRGRCFYSPWTTAEVMEQVPGIQLCADLSHWCVVAERHLDGEDALLAKIFPQVRHIHARVGYAEGPQVPDPRAPEWQGALKAHEAWWDAIWAAQEKAGLPFTTLTPEFGPPDYMHTLPWTRQPVADLWEICHWQAARQAERFKARAKMAGAG